MKLAFSVETGPELLWISGGGVVMPVMKQQKIKYAATQQKQSSHRGAGGLWGLFSANICV